MKSLVTGVFLLLLASYVSAKCGDLFFSTSGGKVQKYNLDALDMIPLTAPVTTPGNPPIVWQFVFSVCSSLPPTYQPCINTNNPNSSACSHSQPGMAPVNNAAVCATFPTVEHEAPPGGSFGTTCFGQWQSSGPLAFQTNVLTTSTGGGVSIRYSGGDVNEDVHGTPAQTATINVICAPKVTGVPQVSAVWSLNSPTVMFNVHHAAGCPKNVKKGLSGGSICLIILTVFIVLYIAGGISYNRFVKGRDGTAMFPNHTFWSGLPGLLRDGFRFLICQPPIGADATYERVEG